MSISPLRKFLTSHWQPLLGMGTLFILTLVLLLWKIMSIMPGYSASELAAYHQSVSLHDILSNPLNLPYKLLVHAAIFIHPHNAAAVRFASALIGFVTVGIFYWLVQHWHGQRVGWMATVLFLTSSRFLHTARLGTPQVLLFSLFALVVYGVWLKEKRQLRFALPIGLLLACVVVYVPGMLWFVIVGVIWQWRTIVDRVWKTPVWLTLTAMLPMLAILFPMGWSIARHPRMAEAFLGVPQPFPHVGTILHNLAGIPLQLFYTHSTLSSDLGTPALLTLDSFAIVMFVFGAYLYLKHLKLVRTSFLIAIFAISCALLSIGDVSVTILLPFIYMIIAAGVAYLLGQWLQVFPRNIFARSTGIVLLSAVILLCCVYNVRRYFVAWPAAASTRALFSQNLIQ